MESLGVQHLNTPADLLVLEVGGGYEILDQEELYEAPSSLDVQAEKVCIISGTITVSP